VKKRLFALLFPSLLLACGGPGTPSVTAPPNEAVSPISTVVPASTVPGPSPSIRPFAGYPYTIPWPADELQTEWRHATAMWDGTARVDHGNRYTDSVATTDGDLFVFGYPTTRSATDLQELIARQAADWHKCDDKATDEEPVNGGAVQGVMAVYRCGSMTVLRWVGVHDGFGLFIGLILDPDASPEVARSHFEQRVGHLIGQR
jgi:hypothetical protein